MRFAPGSWCARVLVLNPGLVCEVLSKSQVKHREHPWKWLPSGPVVPDSSEQAACVEGHWQLNGCPGTSPKVKASAEVGDPNTI